MSSPSPYAIPGQDGRGQAPPGYASQAPPPGYSSSPTPMAYPPGTYGAPAPGMYMAGPVPVQATQLPPQAYYGHPPGPHVVVPEPQYYGQGVAPAQPPPGYAYPPTQAEAQYMKPVYPNVQPPGQAGPAAEKRHKGPHHGGDVEGAQGSDQDGPKGPRDVWAAVLFLVHLAVIAYLGLGPGLKALKAQGTGSASASSSSSTPATAYGGVAVVLAAASAWSMAWIMLLIKYSENIVKLAILGNVAMGVAGAVVALIYASWGLLFFCLLSAALSAMWYYCVRDRIPFAAQNLKLSATAVAQYPSTIVLAFALTVLQVGWTLLWYLAVTGVAIIKDTQATGDDQDSLSPGVLFLLLISLFWGSLVIKYVLFCTVTGAVADWWFVGNSENVVARSLSRSLTTSFGSICYGALIIAVLKAMKEMVKNARRDGERDSALACVMQCLLDCVERLMIYFNRYALTYASVYGTPFFESGRKVYDLFSRVGFTTIINDDLSETTLNLICFVIGVLTAVIGYIYAAAFQLGGSWPTMLVIVGFFSGFLIAITALSVVDAGVACIFVCFAEDPNAFKESHPGLYEPLVAAWSGVGYRDGSVMRP